MLKVYNIKDKQKYIEEVAILTQKEWGKQNLTEEEFKLKIKKKIDKIKLNMDNPYYCKLILLDNDILIGFISIFPKDGEERQDLSPWYATMYVKEEYRGKGYSRILNGSILAEAKKRNIKKLFLKTDLENYYEKFGARYLEKLNNGEKIYYIDIPADKISIIGGSGSGKSTLANILSESMKIPVIHLDAINYKPNWIQVDKVERDKIISGKSNEDKWIIDGNYNKTLKERLIKSDLIIWLDYSSYTQIKGVVKRIAQNYNKERSEIPGCKERINLKFIKYVATYNKVKRPEMLEILKDIPEDKLLIFKKQKDLNNWLKKYVTNKK